MLSRAATGVLSVVVWALAGVMSGDPAAGRMQAEERQLYVSVVDDSDAPVTGLQSDDFIVREDDIAREILRVVPATTPMQVALLVDTSQPATPYIADLRRGVESFVNAMQDGHEMALITYGERPTIVVDWTTDPKRMLAGVGRLFAAPGSGAMLLEALIETSRGIQRRETERPVIVVLATEGIEFSNDHYSRVLEALEASQAAMYALVLTTGASNLLAEETRNRDLVLSRGPVQTGGRRINIAASLAFPDRLKRLAAILTNQYLVTYARPETLIPPEEIEVAVTRPDADARGTPVPASNQKGRPP